MAAFVGIVIVAALASLMLTPLVRQLALHCGLVDVPDDPRKMHSRQVALGGGAAVFLAIVITMTVAFLVPSSVQAALLEQRTPLLGLLLAAGLVCLVGITDDRIGLRGRQKLSGQLLAALLVIAFGVWIDRIEILGVQLELGVLSLPFTVFWLLGAMNAINLLDGIDGLATTVGTIMTLTIAAMALLTGHPAQAALALAMTGSLLGVLCFNFPPARIFLGDAGSMLIGLIAGTVAIGASVKGPATMALAAPLAVWAIPIFDSAMAIARRKLTGRSIYETDRGHLHHCLLKRGYNGRSALYAISSMCALTAAGALASVWLHNELLATAAASTVLATLLVTGLFGRSELLLLTSRLASTSISLLRPARGRKQEEIGPRKTQIQLQGSRNWEELWDWLTHAVDLVGLYRVELDVNLPHLHESYHATWKQPEHCEAEECWHLRLPLHVGERRIGRLELTARSADSLRTRHWMGLTELVGALEDRIHELLGAEPVASMQAIIADTPASDEVCGHLVLLSECLESQDTSDTTGDHATGHREVG